MANASLPERDDEPHIRAPKRAVGAAHVARRNPVSVYLVEYVEYVEGYLRVQHGSNDGGGQIERD